MKQLLSILFLFVFCVNQLHIIETIAKYKSKYSCKTGAENNDTSSDQEEDREEENIEKEFECFITNNTNLLSKIASTQLQHYIYYSNSLYSNPFTQKDIKPPCFA